MVNPIPIPANPAPITTPSGRNQLIERSVGNPGIWVIAKKVPENAIAWKIGISTDGRNADGSRVMLTMLRRINPTDAGKVWVFATERSGPVVVSSSVVIAPPADP